MQVQPYIHFDGRCEEAIEFYRRAVGAEVSALMRFKENPNPEMSPPGMGEKIMHSALRIGQTTLMASDGGQCPAAGSAAGPTFKGFSLTLVASNDAEADRLFNALGQGGQVQMPLGKTFFASSFGMLTDRFGVSWMVINER